MNVDSLLSKRNAVGTLKGTDEAEVMNSSRPNPVLSNYGFAVGLWKVVSTLYGGLVEVKFDDHQLVGTRFFPPPDPHINQQLRRKKIFVITIDDEGKCECICFRGYKGPHQANISRFESDGFQLDCSDSEVHRHPGGPSQEFALWVKEELGVETVDKTNDTDLLTSKCEALSQEVSLKCRPLHLPQNREFAVIQPGLFKGTYTPHGLELILLTYDDEENFAVLTKITGDPNVPAGKVAIVADLNAPIDAETQTSTKPGVGRDGREPLQGAASGLALQRFILPKFFNSRHQTVPEICQYKFHSKGRIASSGYVDAKFGPGQWIVFDENTVGQVALYLVSFITFKRVTETFST